MHCAVAGRNNNERHLVLWRCLSTPALPPLSAAERRQRAAGECGLWRHGRADMGKARDGWRGRRGRTLGHVVRLKTRQSIPAGQLSWAQETAETMACGLVVRDWGVGQVFLFR